ncbi:hypothetical protein [Streptomyces sp. NPDC057250]|uniref:hypothetical protein n=1 Tax=Streptomyces sp. NPDC057250 TaxID=3346068 RepID=UPI003644893B
MELIDTRRADIAAGVYVDVLGWPLSAGHRRRPRQGCTCGTPDCPTPGAHPAPGATVWRSGADLARELEASPGAGLIAWTEAFDAVSVPRTVGMAAMVSLDRIAPVPCLVHETTAVLLVLPATGRYALDGVEAGEARSGPEGWIALPPSYGVRWDTTPWVEQANTPVRLLHGRDIRSHLREAMKYRTGAEVTP